MLIALTGGIGVGKSVVASVLRNMGYPVYDCDSRAKILMDEDEAIITRIGQDVASDAIVEGKIDRRALSKAVFGNPDKLECLNRIVHSVVRDDLLIWKGRFPLAFVETAILYSSGFDAIVDAVWEVTAPLDVRISRVIGRNPELTGGDVCNRIKAQAKELESQRHPDTHIIINDDVRPLLPQIENLVDLLYC